MNKNELLIIKGWKLNASHQLNDFLNKIRHCTVFLISTTNENKISPLLFDNL